ncbi:MAG: hypothetical protein JNM55_21200 [Anaerolineales bacterium]|nr:hypothetical protein [Anaerolineales bacterium]
MSLELEVSRSFLRNVILGISTLALTALGYFSSPQCEDHKPMLLTPSLARVVRYQHSAQKWIFQIEEINAELAAIQEQPTMDLFSQDRQISHVYGTLMALREEMDGTEAPPTLENLHAILIAVVAKYLDATLWTAKWASEPTAENFTKATDTWLAASQQLQQVLVNPWLQVGS